jgi:hypothetical protein
MKWLDRFTQSYNSYASSRYKARVEATQKANEALEAPQRALKEAVSGDPETWGLPDFSYDLNVGNRAGYRGTVTVTDELAEGAADVVFEPLNLVGAGLVTKGARGIQQASKAAKEYFGPDAGKGGATASIANYIDNFYGPSGSDTKTDKAISALSGASPDKVRGTRQKITGLFNWGARSAVDGLEYVLNPQARAAYKEMGITPGSQRHVARALADDAIHKAAAQVQYTSHIGQQAGRRGAVAPEVKRIMEKSGVTDYFAYTPGSYASAIKQGQLYPTSGGRKSSMGADDLKIIEDHFGSVWKAPNPKGADVPFKDAEGTILLIKAPGLGTQTGDHYNDIIKAGGYVGDLYRSFQKHKNKPSVEQLWTDLKKASDANKKYNAAKKKHEPRKWTLSEKSSTLENAQENGIWLTNSKKGRAYTEGGINYLVKVKPNGNIFAVMSDEHNFLENIAAKGDALVRKVTRREQGANLISQFEKVLPHRLVAVTPPMQANIFNLRSQLAKEGPQISNVTTGQGAVSRSDLEAFTAARPSERGVQIERQRNIGAAEALAGAGMLTGGNREER